MILRGQFPEQLRRFHIAPPEPIFPNEVAISQLIHCLDRLGIEELAAGHDIDVLLVLEHDLPFGVEFFLEVLFVGVWAAELVDVDVCLFDDWKVVGKRGGAVLVVLVQPYTLAEHVPQGQRGPVVAQHRGHEQIVLHGDKALVA